jgi:hypothetical protein
MFPQFPTVGYALVPHGSKERHQSQVWTHVLTGFDQWLEFMTPAGSTLRGYPLLLRIPEQVSNSPKAVFCLRD